MKIFARIVLILIFVPVSLVAIISSTIKFQLFDPNFWKNDFKTNNVYPNLSNDLKIYTESQNLKAGGKISDLKIITNVITPVIVEDFITHNLDNTLGFINGNKKVLLVYLPINKTPEEIPLTALMTKFNIDASTIPVSQIAYLGRSINYLLIGSIAILLLSLLFLFLLTESGDRFLALGLSFVLSGFLILSSSKIITSIQITNKIVLDILPSVLQQIVGTWTWIGFSLMAFGIICFIIKKPHASRQI